MYNLDLTTAALPQNMTKLFISNLFTPLGGYPKGLPVSPASLLAMQRQSLITLAESHKTALSGLQAVLRQQSDIISGVLAWQNTLLSIMLQEGTPEEKISRQAALTQNHYQNSIRDIRQVQDTIASTLRQASDMLHRNTLQALNLKDITLTEPVLATPANSDAPSGNNQATAA
ncbi:MAG: phasin family protein [Alphaproteobacteria bacterium]|nr:phasin family protein [Alphaproteobacteria bacterium]